MDEDQSQEEVAKSDNWTSAVGSAGVVLKMAVVQARNRVLVSLDDVARASTPSLDRQCPRCFSRHRVTLEQDVQW